MKLSTSLTLSAALSSCAAPQVIHQPEAQKKVDQRTAEEFGSEGDAILEKIIQTTKEIAARRAEDFVKERAKNFGLTIQAINSISFYSHRFPEGIDEDLEIIVAKIRGSDDFSKNAALTKEDVGTLVQVNIKGIDRQGETFDELVIVALDKTGEVIGFAE